MSSVCRKTAHWRKPQKRSRPRRQRATPANRARGCAASRASPTPPGPWSKARRVIARIELSPRGRDTRYIVTNLEGGRGKHLYEKLYSARGQAENHIKAWKAHLAADRTSCSDANANQMRLMLHGCAYWLWWKLRAACPKRSPWRRAQFDTLRLRLVKLAASIVEKKTRIIVTLPASCPQQGLLRLLFDAIAPQEPA